MDLRSAAKVTHASDHWVATAVAYVPTYSAKDSLSHRSSHHFMVTRSPNHMWASSCMTTTVRNSSRASEVLPRNSSRSSDTVTQPAFSIAPKLYCGAYTWS